MSEAVAFEVRKMRSSELLHHSCTAVILVRHLKVLDFTKPQEPSKSKKKYLKNVKMI